MSHIVTVTLSTAQASFAVGTVSAGIQVTLVSSAEGSTPVVQTLSAAPYIATFEDIEAGDYNIHAVAIDADGKEIGDAITGTATVSPDNVSIDVPSSMIVSVQ
jgi:hypothetical protein